MFFEDFERKRSLEKPAEPATPPQLPMIYSLTVTCVWGWRLRAPCIRVIEIEDTATLLDLHEAIQDAVAFDRDHLFEFFAGRTCRNRSLLFGDSASWEDEAADFDSIELKRIWPLPDRMKLFYHFDFGDDWKFQITKGRSVKPPGKGVRYPRVVKATGSNPKQYGESDETD